MYERRRHGGVSATEKILLLRCKYCPVTVRSYTLRLGKRNFHSIAGARREGGTEEVSEEVRDSTPDPEALA